MSKIVGIKLITPKPYQEIGAQFRIAGWVPKSWLITDFGSLDNRLFLDFIAIDGRTFMGSSIGVQVYKGWLSRFIKNCYFSEVVQFNQFNVSFIKSSQGRIVIQLSGHKEDTQSLFIPLVVRELEPEGGADPEVIKRHRRVGEMIKQYKLDLKNYYQELEDVRKSRQAKDKLFENEVANTSSYSHDWMMVGGILNILGNAQEPYEEYLYSDEDKREQELEKKYKDAIEWRGPLLGGLVGMANGFEFRVYSNDHGKHFHVIHRGKGINARFSFPEIELVSYKKSRNTIRTKEVDSIRAFFKIAENFKKLEKEFEKKTNVAPTN